MWEPRRLTTLWASTACYRIALPLLVGFPVRGPTFAGGFNGLAQIRRAPDCPRRVRSLWLRWPEVHTHAAPIHLMRRPMMVGSGCLLMHIYCCPNTLVPCLCDARKARIQALSEFQKYCFYCPENRNGYKIEDLEFGGRMALKHVGTHITEFYSMSKTSVSAERRPSSVSQTWTKDVPLQILISWFQPLGAHTNIVFLNYNKKPAIFTLGDLNSGN
jgi:hypothetical protein